MVELLKVPYLGTAEDDVLLATWLVPVGGRFQRGDTLAVVETLKAAFDVEAEAAGVLVRELVPAGRRVPLHAALAVVAGPDESPTDAEIDACAATAPELESSATDAVMAAEPPTAAPVPPLVGTQGGDVVPAARLRAAELGVDLARVRGTGPGGLIRVVDVEASIAHDDGRLDPGFVADLARDAAAFATLSSDLKVAIYRRFGARIGDDVQFASGAIVRADRIVVGAGSRFGAGVTIEAEEFVAGRLAQFGARGRLRCRRITIGDNAFFAPDVEVGGGGAMEPEAELVVGSHGFVGEHTHLNPCRRLELGDEVVVSRSAVLMTHSFGGSILDGYPNRFAPIRIGDRCQIGIAAMLFPGVTMGDGSILLSNSTLVTAVPEGRLYGGVPARDMRAAAHPPESRTEVARELVAEFARQLTLRGFDVTCRAAEPDVELVVAAAGGTHRLVFADAVPPSMMPPSTGPLRNEDIWVSTAIPDDVFAAMPAERVAIDLGGVRIRGAGGPLADAFREFLRKRGVRLEPRTWTYPGGWL